MNDSERVELNELCSTLVDGRLTEEQNKRLQNLLRGSDEAQQFYVRSMQLSASLYSYASEMQSEAAEPRNVIRPTFWRRNVWPLAAAAAVVAVGVWIGRSLIPEAISPDEDQEFIARISGSKDLKWASAAAFQNGDELHRGQRLELTSGFAEITFDSGALIVVEGPASVDLDSAWQATLRRGTLKANIPQEAIGFKVSNASVDVVDLGTEFSMTADDDGSAEVFVLNGQVEVEPRVAANVAPRKILMKEKQSRRFALNGVSDVRDSEQKFVKLAKHVSLDLPKKAAGYVHWSFDGSGDGPFTGELIGPVRGKGPVSMSIKDTSPIAGKFGGAVEFSSTSGAQFSTSDFGFRAAKTMAFWVKIPENANATDGATFAGFGSAELGWNRSPSDGAQGALRISNSRGHAVASTPLRDGRWHHIAAVISAPPAGQGKPAGKWQARLYVDGRLDAWTGKNPVRKGSQLPVTPIDLLTLGSVGEEKGFRGAIDELFIADRPLTPMEIRSLMRSNKPYLPEAFAVN
jgi:hypothetical protein